MPIISPLTGRPIEVTPEAPIPRSTDFQNYTFRSPISGRELYVETDFPLEPPAPPDDLTDSVSLYDYGKSIMSGGAGTFSALGWLVEQVGAKDLGNAMQELGNNAVDYWNDQLSPAAKRELAKEFITKDENGEYQWGDPSLSTVGLFGAQSLLGTAAGAGLGGGATRVLQLFANPVGRSALVSAATAGSAAAASKLKFVDSVLGAAGFGIGEDRKSVV